MGGISEYLPEHDHIFALERNDATICYCGKSVAEWIAVQEAEPQVVFFGPFTIEMSLAT